MQAISKTRVYAPKCRRYAINHTPEAAAGKYDSVEARRQYFDTVSSQLGLKSKYDWYKVTGLELERFGGSSPLRLYKGSISKALEDVYPDHPWHPWRFSEGGTNRKLLWSDPTTRLRFMEHIRSELGYRSLDDFYKLSKADVTSRGGSTFLRSMNNSLIKLVQATYPDHEWLPWRFKKAGANTWAEKGNFKKFFDWAATQLKMKDLNDWYRAKPAQVAELGGRTILTKFYSSSLPAALKDIYPEHEWLDWKFSIASRAWWKPVENQRKFMEWFGKDILHVRSMDDWYRLQKSHLVKNGASRLIIGYYNSSCARLLRTVFPSHTWLEWKFHRCPKGFWEKASNRRRFFEWLIKEKGLEKANIDKLVLSLAPELISKEGGATALVYHGSSVKQALADLFPEMFSNKPV